MAYIGKPPASGAYEKQTLTADGSTTTFTLNFTIGSSSSLIVSVVGVVQEPIVKFNVKVVVLPSAVNVCFSYAPDAGGTSWVAVKTSDFTAVGGEGYFVNTTSGAVTVTLPTSPSLGDEVSVVDYAGTADTNNITIGRNSHKIQGDAANLTISTERAAFTLVYVDATQGWLLKDK
jgi:hypothetical protein